jgi:hypothetical protein
MAAAHNARTTICQPDLTRGSRPERRWRNGFAILPPQPIDPWFGKK